jgi:hypothetical protein
MAMRQSWGGEMTAGKRDYHAEYLRRRGTGHEKNRESYLKYQSDYGRKLRVVLKIARARAEYLRNWRVRKEKQVVAVAEFLEAFDHFEYVKRCIEISNEAKHK